jgi:hypothetical protein
MSNNDDGGGGDGGGYDVCGANSGENYWYTGRTQCFRANVAFTLYGTLKGQINARINHKCNRKTFINSVSCTSGHGYILCTVLYCTLLHYPTLHCTVLYLVMLICNNDILASL